MIKLLISILILSSFQYSCFAKSPEYYQGILALAAVLQKSDVELTKCLCDGTGRSGDGLGPCQCGDDCDCKKGSLDQAIEKSDPLNIVHQPKIELLYFSTSNCEPCNRVETEFQKMILVGWRIGTKRHSPSGTAGRKTGQSRDTGRTAHIIRINQANLPGGVSQFGVSSFPCFILLADGVEVKRHSGFMDMHQIAAFRKSVPDRRSLIMQESVGKLMIAQDINIPGLRTPFEKSLDILKKMLGTSYSPNSYITVKSPNRIEVSLEKRDGKIHIRFHGTKPSVSAVGIFESEVTHMIAEGNRITIYWNGVLGLLKNSLTVEFD